MKQNVQWVIIDGEVKKNPSKEEIKNAQEVIYIYGGEEDVVIQTGGLITNIQNVSILLI